MSNKKEDKKEDVPHKSFKKGKQQRAKKRHNEKRFMKEIQKGDYDLGNIENFEKW